MSQGQQKLNKKGCCSIVQNTSKIVAVSGAESAVLVCVSVW